MTGDEELEIVRTKVCVILGAGASADASNEGGPPANPTWKPPLASELFGRRMVFQSGAARPYPGVRALASELGELGPLPLEAKLLEFARDPRDLVRRYFRQVPLYLRDLLLSVTTNYTGGENPGNHVRLCLNLLKEHQTAFLDLNYDDYLEKALPVCGDGLEIRNLSDYVELERVAIVGKVHGSIHWGTPVGPADAPSAHLEAYYAFDPLGPCPELIFAPSRDSTFGWRDRNGRLLYPVLTAPLAGKDHTALVCPKGHLDALKTFLEGCTHYVVIGTSGLDDDLLGFLRQYVHSVELVHYVNKGETATESCKTNFEKAAPAFRNARRSIAFDGGFRLYLGSQHFRDFLQDSA